jgi:uncharacterized coiled-coil protein SlyX
VFAGTPKFNALAEIWCGAKEKLLQAEQKVAEQEKIVAEIQEKLIECRIKVEKFKSSRKKMRLYEIEELRKEQNGDR